MSLSVSPVRIFSFSLFKPADDFIHPKLQEKISDIRTDFDQKVNHHKLRKSRLLIVYDNSVSRPVSSDGSLTAALHSIRSRPAGSAWRPEDPHSPIFVTVSGIVICTGTDIRWEKSRMVRSASVTTGVSCSSPAYRKPSEGQARTDEVPCMPSFIP